MAPRVKPEVKESAVERMARLTKRVGDDCYVDQDQRLTLRAGLLDAMVFACEEVANIVEVNADSKVEAVALIRAFIHGLKTGQQ